MVKGRPHNKQSERPETDDWKEWNVNSDHELNHNFTFKYRNNQVLKRDRAQILINEQNQKSTANFLFLNYKEWKKSDSSMFWMI